jgi:predicted metal-dependent hydrolase
MNTKKSQIKLGDLILDVIHKDIKNVHLSVYPPTGRVRISAPRHMELDTVRVFAISKLGWIRKQQEKFQNQIRQTKRDYISRENHYYLGKRHLFKVIEHNAPPKVIKKHNRIELYVRPSSSQEKKQSVLNEWYRQSLRDLVPKYIARYEKILQVTVNDFGIKRMKTKWGTCNIEAQRIWLNLELAKKPLQCIEYIVVHEMVHLLERNHNSHFISLMDKSLPQWREYREELNRSPLGHVEWDE